MSYINKIYALFDVAPLIKSFRNVLIKDDIKTPDGVISWNVIKRMYFLDSCNITRMCLKIGNQHIYPNNFDKMKVSYTASV